MAFAFDGHNFGRVLDDAERLVRDARELEKHLAELVDGIDRGVTTLPGPRGAVHALRATCVEARAHRQRTESLVRHLAGDVAHVNGSPPRRRVLVVDDAEDNRELVSLVLESAGYGTLTASDGLEGVIVAHYARPDVVVMDVTMPVLNGIEAARLLKASPATQDMRLIAYTARPDVEELAITRLFVDVLKKPAVPEAILAAVERNQKPDR